MARTQTTTDKRDFLFHSALAEYGPVRITVDGDVREFTTKKGEKRKVVDITLMPKGKPAERFTYWVENDEIEAGFADMERGIPFTVIAEGSRDDATLVDVGAAVSETPEPQPDKPPAEEPKRTETPRSPKPHDHSKQFAAEELKAAKAARVFLARRLSLKRLCVKATIAFDKECQGEGAPPMSPESFWSQVTNFYISVESEGLKMRAGFADAMPAGLTFDRMAELAQPSPAAAKPAAQPKPEPAADNPTDNDSEPF